MKVMIFHYFFIIPPSQRRTVFLENNYFTPPGAIIFARKWQNITSEKGRTWPRFPKTLGSSEWFKTIFSGVEFVRNALNLRDQSYHRVHDIKITTDQCGNSNGERWTTYFDKFWWSTHRLVHLPVIMDLVPISIQYFHQFTGNIWRQWALVVTWKLLLGKLGPPLSSVMTCDLLTCSFLCPAQPRWEGEVVRPLIKRKFALL